MRSRAKLTITEYMGLSSKPEPDNTRYQATLERRTGRRNEDAGWHGFKLLYNPLCAEFGIRTAQELEEFIRDDLPDFAMVRADLPKYNGGLVWSDFRIEREMGESGDVDRVTLSETSLFAFLPGEGKRPQYVSTKSTFIRRE